jgi:hypothetical protein
MKAFFSFATALVLACLGAAPASAGVVYDNTNGFANGFSVNAWCISTCSSDDTPVAYAVADSFTFGSSTDVQGVDFWIWEYYPGDLTSVQWSIVSNNGPSDYPFDGSVLASGTASTFTSTPVVENGYDLYVYEESFNLPGGVSLNAGTTYWLILQNAVTSDGYPVYWDQSDGSSVAYQNTNGASSGLGDCYEGSTTCSETFDLDGSTVPEPGSLMLFGSGALLLAGALRRRAIR